MAITSRSMLASKLSAAPWRVELSHSPVPDLLKSAAFLRKHDLQHVNVANKNKEDDLLATAALLMKELPAADLCMHYSLNYKFRRTPEATLDQFIDFCQGLHKLQQQHSGSGSASVLLVSGTRRRRLDTVQALQLIHERRLLSRVGLPLYVAYNPYLPDPEEAEEERQRLRAKLQYAEQAGGLVRGIYLQFGSDVQRLRQGLDYLDSLLEEAGHAQQQQQQQQPSWQQKRQQRGGLEVFGSLFVPSRRLLAQMRFRPWRGVFLSEEYLSSVEGAERITAEMLGVYSEKGVVPIVETAVKTEGELQRVRSLMSEDVNSLAAAAR